jgi:hypothetical protein
LAIVRSPVLWGLLATVGFYALVRSGTLARPGIVRYFDAHWTLNVETGAFFVALAALVIKGLDVAAQARLLRSPVLGEAPPGGQPISDVKLLLSRIAALPRSWQESYLVGRFRAALEYIDRKQSLEGLEGELHYLADADAGRMHASYALVRILIWAIPILGFLGTVIGITIAIANLSPEALEQSLPAVTGGLGVAFDTTALALGLCMLLMVVQYVVDKAEGRLLSRVDEQAARELIGRFQDSGAVADPLVGAVRRMAETVVKATERLVVQQTELWKATVEAAHQHWTQVASVSGKQLETTLSTTLERSLNAHASRLAAQEKAAAEAERAHWEQVREALLRAADTVAGAQREMVRQGEMLTKVVDATAQLEKLETALNRNLTTLAGAGHFEETVMSLSAAIHLLTGRLSPSADARTVELAGRRTGQAA